MTPTKSERTLESELREHNESIRRLEGEKATAMAAAETLVENEREAGRNPQDPSSDSFTKVDAAYMVADELGDQVAQHREAADKLARLLGGRASASTLGKKGGVKALVEAIMETPEYQRLLETKAFSGTGAHIELPGIQVVSAEQLAENLQSGLPMFAATADVGSFVAPDQRLFPPVPSPVRRIRLLDLITVTTTQSDLVRYVEETLRTDVAEAVALGDPYPEASYGYEPREAPVRDIGHFTAAHRSNLADAGELQGLIEGRLEVGVELGFERQIVQGDGGDGEVLGILNTDGIGHVERNNTGSERLVEVIHRAITNVRLNLFDEPDAIGIHPTEYEEVIFEKDGVGQYLLGPASQATSRQIWGFPAVVTSVFPNDTALVGAYKTGAIAWIREGVSVRASDSHEDFFIRRMVALLAEMRAAFAAWQPRAFCEADLS